MSIKNCRDTEGKKRKQRIPCTEQLLKGIFDNLGIVTAVASDSDCGVYWIKKKWANQMLPRCIVLDSVWPQSNVKLGLQIKGRAKQVLEWYAHKIMGVWVNGPMSHYHYFSNFSSLDPRFEVYSHFLFLYNIGMEL